MQSAFRATSLRIATVLLGVTLAAAARCETVNFQDTAYTISTVTLGPTVPGITTNDLIFVTATNGQKFLAIPSDPTQRGAFDSVKQRFYMLDRPTGQINAFTSINGALLNLDGTLFSATPQIPAAGTPALETISKPLTIAETGVDVCVVSDVFLGYRTDGPNLGDEKIYSIVRPGTVTANISAVSPVPVSLKNADPSNGNLSVFVEYDKSKDTFLTAQSALDQQNNTSFSDRITAFKHDGSIAGEIVLTGNSSLPSYTGGEEGLAVDPDTGTIYLLLTNRTILVFAPVRPALISLRPAVGTVSGGDTLVLTGTAFPPDAQVFIDGTLALNIVVISSTAIQATTPPHVSASVDVTVTGSGIPAGQPLILANSFTFKDAPPTAQLTASPVQGLPPLPVMFDSSGSTDSDGTIVARVIDYGDGSSLKMPSNTVTASHTYQAKGTYVARLTVTDNSGNDRSTIQVIVVGGEADLVLRAMQIKLNDGITGPVGTADSVKLTGEIVLPGDTKVANGKVTVGFINPVRGALEDTSDSLGKFVEATDTGGAISGGQFSGGLNADGKASYGILKFAMTPLKKKGYTPNTQSVTFSGKNDLTAALNAAVVNLKYDQAGVELALADKNMTRIGEVIVVIRLQLDADNSILQYRKLAVVEITPGHGISIKLKKN